jgi:hypothetical protein
MSKFTEDFARTYGDTEKLSKITKELKKKQCFNKDMRRADMNLTKVTQGKLGRTL